MNIFVDLFCRLIELWFNMWWRYDDQTKNLGSEKSEHKIIFPNKNTLCFTVSTANRHKNRHQIVPQKSYGFYDLKNTVIFSEKLSHFSRRKMKISKLFCCDFPPWRVKKTYCIFIREKCLVFRFSRPIFLFWSYLHH